MLVHGPDREVETVKRMFRSFVQEGKHFHEIAAELNADQIRTTRGLRWNGETVGKILENEKYAGNLIFNRTSFKLKQQRVDNPPDMWIRRDNAFPPIVSPAVFAKAQEILRERRQRRSDQEVLDRLAALGREKGHLTRAIVAAAEDMPSTEAYRRRFGSLMAAYELSGYQPAPRQRRAAKTAQYRIALDRIAAEIVAAIERLGGRAIVDRAAGIVVINDECRVSLGWARPTSCGSGRVRWRVRASSQARSDLTLLARIDATDTAIAAYYLLPTPELVNCGMKNLRMSNPIFAAACRYDSLDVFCRLCAGLEERRVA
ncbi:recombinase family protein [Bradyrhizobium sp. Lot33]